MRRARHRRRVARWILSALCAWRAGSASAQEPLIGVGFDDQLSGVSVLESLSAGAPAATAALRFVIRLALARDEIQTQPDVFDFDALDSRIAFYASHGAAVVIDLGESVTDPAALEAWRRYVGAVAARYRTRVRAYVVRAPDLTIAAADAAFAVKSTAISLKAADDRAQVVLGTFGPNDATRLAGLFDGDVTPYVDAFGVTGIAAETQVGALIETRAPAVPLVLLDEPLGPDATAAVGRFVNRQLQLLGTRISAAFYLAPPSVVVGLRVPLASLGFLLQQPTAALDGQAIGLKLTRDGADVTGAVTHRMLFGLKTAANALVYTSPEGPVQIAVTERTGVRPAIVDGTTGQRVAVEGFAYDATTATARFTAPASFTPLVVDWSDGLGRILVDNQDISAARLPSVAEIIARHQQAQAVQDALLRRYVANATMTQSFRTMQTDPGWDVVTENRFFADGPIVEWEERRFRLNGTEWGADRPPFPLLQAEKVLSLPLDLRLNADYRYQLDGVETIGGRTCFVIRFDSMDAGRSLYRGTVWIDRASYLKSRLRTVQTQISPPVLSSEETQDFTTVGTIGDREIQRLTRSLGRQTMLIAGRSLAVERQIVFDGFLLNPENFDDLRQSARASEHVMYRDTDDGLRYFIKKDGVRQVADAETTTAKALALGVTYDPSFDFPIPLGGLNYLDFDFLGKDNQLAVVFGGVLALANMQRPKLIGERIGASVDLFAIAVPSNDRTYTEAGETPEERVLTIPFTTGLNVGWQMTQFQRLTASYQFRYDYFGRDALTGASFDVPASGVTNGVGLGWDWKRAGYSVVVGATAYARATWHAWGAPGDYSPAQRDYLKYSAGVTRDFVFGIQKIHLNAAYYGGDDLDRFSKYQFGFFDDNRIHGVPSSGLRFEQLGMFRSSYSFNLFEQYRFDVFLDHALGLDRAVSARWQHVTGLGFGFNVRGPKGTMLRGDFGKSLLPAQYREPGTLVFQFQVLKPL